MAAQFTVENGPEDLGEFIWVARLSSSLPVPLSPVIRTVVSVWETDPASSRTSHIFGEAPTIF